MDMRTQCIADCGCAGAQLAFRCTFDPDCPKCRPGVMAPFTWDPNGLVEVKTLPCPWCGAAPKTLTVHAAQLDLFLHSRTALIQDCFPNMSNDDRERMKTGICAPCWTSIMVAADDSDDVVDEPFA